MVGGELNPADAAFAARLRERLGEEAVRPPEARYLEEPRGRFSGQAGAVVRPGETAQVAQTLRLCSEARVPVIAYGGGTGLVGGQIAEDGPPPVLLSLERMNRVRALDTTDNVLVAEAGAVLADVQAAAREAGRLFPLSLASEGTARIGGLLATNAGGVNVLRYGNARDLCLGVEAVMADGAVHHGLSRLVKDNMGYDLRHLLIGSEGTLAVITAASLRLFPVPRETATAWIAVAGPQAALDLLALARERLGGSVSAFELIHRQGLAFLDETLPDLARPPAMETDWVVLCEAADGVGAEVQARFLSLMETALEDGLASDGALAQSEAQRARMWAVRESIPEANRLIGSVSSHDISVPPSQVAAFIARAGRAVAGISPDLRVNCFGHLGDGNLHYNVFPPAGRGRADFADVRAAVKRAVHDVVHDLGGSVGAEHGVGRLKVGDLERYGDPALLVAMRAIKKALDPAGILNPGAMLAR